MKYLFALVALLNLSTLVKSTCTNDKWSFCNCTTNGTTCDTCKTSGTQVTLSDGTTKFCMDDSKLIGNCKVGKYDVDTSVTTSADNLYATAKCLECVDTHFKVNDTTCTAKGTCTDATKDCICLTGALGTCVGCQTAGVSFVTPNSEGTNRCVKDMTGCTTYDTSATHTTSKCHTCAGTHFKKEDLTCVLKSTLTEITDCTVYSTDGTKCVTCGNSKYPAADGATCVATVTCTPANADCICLTGAADTCAACSTAANEVGVISGALTAKKCLKKIAGCTTYRAGSDNTASTCDACDDTQYTHDNTNHTCTAKFQACTDSTGIFADCKCTSAAPAVCAYCPDQTLVLSDMTTKTCIKKITGCTSYDDASTKDAPKCKTCDSATHFIIDAKECVLNAQKLAGCSVHETATKCKTCDATTHVADGDNCKAKPAAEEDSASVLAFSAMIFAVVFALL